MSNLVQFHLIPGQVWCRVPPGVDWHRLVTVDAAPHGRLVLCERWEASTRSGLIVEHRPVPYHQLYNADL
jgi:hypothetical protein